VFLFGLSSLCILCPMLPVYLECSCLINTSVFCNVYFKANKAIVATLFPLRISYVNDFTSLDVLDLNFLLLLMT
jgi:hypothetical protein